MVLAEFELITHVNMNLYICRCAEGFPFCLSSSLSLSQCTVTVSHTEQEVMGNGDVDQVSDAEHEKIVFKFISLHMPSPFSLSLPLCSVHYC